MKEFSLRMWQKVNSQTENTDAAFAIGKEYKLYVFKQDKALG